jgi:hypothetical protein
MSLSNLLQKLELSLGAPDSQSTVFSINNNNPHLKKKEYFPLT